jgi:methyl-accepting chemotaxis protein
MAVTYPAHLRGMTAGAFRQVKQQGGTTASGGWHSMDNLKRVALDANTFLQPNEPLGKYMTTLKATAEEATEMTEVLFSNTRAMVDQAKVTSKQLNELSGKMRDGAEKLNSAIEKFNKVVGDTNFAETAKHAESLVNSLERLAVLEASGTLEKVMKAMSK